MAHAQAGVEALLLLRLELGRGRAVPLAFGDEGARAPRFVLGDGLGQRMIGRDRQEARAEQRVGARGEHLDQLVALRRRARPICEADQQAFGAADPVRLHQPDLVRPALEAVERLEQVLAHSR